MKRHRWRAAFGRNLDYYTGFVFELRDGRNPNTRTIDKVRGFIDGMREQNKNL